jgi:hypothetical protein
LLSSMETPLVEGPILISLKESKSNPCCCPDLQLCIERRVQWCNMSCLMCIVLSVDGATAFHEKPWSPSHDQNRLSECDGIGIHICICTHLGVCKPPCKPHLRRTSSAALSCSIMYALKFGSGNTWHLQSRIGLQAFGAERRKKFPHFCRWLQTMMSHPYTLKAIGINKPLEPPAKDILYQEGAENPWGSGPSPFAVIFSPK